MRIIKLTSLVFVLVVSVGCAPLSKTGKFVWNAPGKVASGAAKTGKFVWNAPGKIVSGAAKTGKFVWNITPKSGPQLYETAKFIWGSSVKRLEEARVDAIKGTYRCSFNDCYDSVLTLARSEPVYVKKYNEDGKEIDDKGNVKAPDPVGFFDVFINDRVKKRIVVMGIKGNVDTTEVGIFFSQPNLTTVKLEVSSLSSNAKRKVAEAIFTELDSHFSAVK